MTRAATAILCALLSAAVPAQPPTAPPPPGPPRPMRIEAPAVSTLDNGLRVVVTQRRGLPLVTVELLVRSGTETDPPDRAGLADLTASLLTKGTAKRSAPQIAEAAEALGGQLDSGAGWNRSVVTITVTTPKVAAALDLVADVARHPRFAQAELERVRKLALDGLSVSLRNPGTLASLAADRAAFGAGAYGHPAHGTPGSIARVRRADVVAPHARFYRPDNATLIFAGDIDRDAALALARTAFGKWQRPSSALPAAPVDDTREHAPAPIVIAMPGAGQAGVALVAPSIARDAPDYFPGVVANALLGGGYSSRLNQELRIRRGLTYGIGSSLDARRSGGVWKIAAQTKNESAAELVAVVQDEIRRVAQAPAPAEELEARKLAVIGGVSRRFETTEDLAATVASLEANGVPVVEVTHTIEKLAAVTPQQVQDFAQAHFAKAAPAIVVAGDKDKLLEAWRAAYPGVRVIDQAEIDLDSPGLVKAAPGRPPAR